MLASEVWKWDGAPMTARQRAAPKVAKLSQFIVHHQCVVAMGKEEYVQGDKYKKQPKTPCKGDNAKGGKKKKN